MDEDRRPLWDMAMWSDEDEREDRRQTETRELIIFLECDDLPLSLMQGSTPTVYQH